MSFAADIAVGAWNDWNTELLCGAFGRDLVAHQANVLGAGTDEMHVVLGKYFGKPGVLGEKAVTGMHGVGARDLAGCEQGGNVEVAVFGGGRPDADAFIRQTYMHRVFVRGGVYRDRGDAQLLAGAQHPQRDFPAIGNEDLVEHPRRLCSAPTQVSLHSMIMSGWPYSTGWPSSTRIWITVPGRGAGIWFIVFIASIIISGSPAFTTVPISTKGRAPGSGAR